MKLLKKIIIVVIPILVALYFIIGNVFYHFALNANTSASRDIGEKTYVASPSINAQREELEREKDRAFLNEVQPEQLSITSHDGLELQGYLFEQNHVSDQLVVALHGYTGSMRQMTRWNRQVYELGYNVFAPDLRGHGESDGDYYGMGWLDQQDIAHWIMLLEDRYPNVEIVLYGVSMGASAALNFAGTVEDLRSDFASDSIDKLNLSSANIVGVIADSGFTSVASIFETQLHNVLHLPSFPIMNAANTVSKWRIGLDFSEASTVEQVSSIDVPVLFIHGGADTFIPVENVHELAEATRAEHNVWVVEDANHGEAVKVEPDLYREKLAEFLKDVGFE